MDPSNNTFLLSKPKIVRFHNGSIWNLKFTVRFLEACFGGVNPHGTIPRVFSARSQRCIVRTASNLATRRQQVSMPKMEPRLYIVLLQSMSLVYDATLMYKTQWAFDVIMFDAHCTHYRIGKCGIYSWTCNKSRDIGAWRLRSQQNIRGQVVTPLPSEVCHLAGGVTDGQGRWTASAAPIVHKLNLVILYGPLLKLLWNEYMWMLDILCLWDGRISTAPSHRTCSDATLPNPS